MGFKDIFETFVNDSPVSVLTRATLENCFSSTMIDELFNKNAEEQYEGELLFSSVVDVMQLVVVGGRSSVNTAYQDKKEEIGVSLRSVYAKLTGIEVDVSRAMVRETGERVRAVIESMNAQNDLLPGYRVKIADGKHLDRTERRLKPLREINGAPLPGQLIAVLDANARVVIDAIANEDGHASERSLFDELEETVEANDLWIADRNFCTLGLLKGMLRRKASFVIRKHGSLKSRPVGGKKRIGRCANGVVYEQEVTIGTGEDALTLRAIEIELDEPTRDGETCVVILTNLPKRIRALRVAKLYRDRWTIEQAFQHIAQALHAEIKTLAYPDAAIFGFCTALVAANVMSVVKAAIAVANDADPDDLSTYYIADELKAIYGGMMIVLPPSVWEQKFSELRPKQLTRQLLRIAKNVSVKRFRKTPTKKKRPPNNNVGPKTNRPHVSTKRVLDEYYGHIC